MRTTDIELAIQELRSLRDMVRWGASQFNAARLHFGHGIDNAWDEALALARHVLHLDIADDSRAADALLLSDERREIAELFMYRIQERKPAPYLIHEAWFAGMPFYVDERVIIPRSPIAELIEAHFAPWVDEDTPPQRILDVCTGSGCIAIACALAFPQATIDAVDISPPALAVAQHNIERYNLQQAVQLIPSDVFAALPPENRYDIIVSNPPYVSAAEMAALPPEYRHEPELALAAGDDGLDIVARILSEAHRHLEPHGLLIIEVGNSAAAVEQRFPELSFLWLEMKRGGEGVFLLTAEQLQQL